MLLQPTMEHHGGVLDLLKSELMSLLKILEFLKKDEFLLLQ